MSCNDVNEDAQLFHGGEPLLYPVPRQLQGLEAAGAVLVAAAAARRCTLPLLACSHRRRPSRSSSKLIQRICYVIDICFVKCHIAVVDGVQEEAVQKRASGPQSEPWCQGRDCRLGGIALGDARLAIRSAARLRTLLRVRGVLLACWPQGS